MRRTIVTTLIFTISVITAYTQDSIFYKPNEKVTFDTIPYMVKDKYFKSAFNELASMIEDETKYCFKRAVFLVDWAYNEGNPSYSQYCHEIDSITNVLRAFIHINGSEVYKTAPNWAIFEYFTKPSPMNGNRPFVYDFDDFTGQQDFNNVLVNKVMKTHSGQCTTLPLFYKILCDEMGGQSKLALAPNHMYIKHIGEDGRWVNVELTNGSFARDEWYLQTFGISTEAIRNGVFLCALSDKENIAFMLQHLALAYKQKYGNYDYFTLKCADKALEYAPNFCQALVVKYLNLHYFGSCYVKKYGKVWSHFIIKNNEQYKSTLDLLDNLCYSQITDEEYRQNVERAMEEIGSQK